MTIKHSVNAIAFGPAATVDDVLAGLEDLPGVGLTVPEWVLANSGWERAITQLRDDARPVECLLRADWFRLDRPEAWPAQREALTRLVEAAAEIGAPYVYGTTGSAGTLEFDQAVAALAEAVGPVLETARERGVELLIESTNSLRTDVNFVFTLRDQIDVCRSVGIGLCVDLVAVWPERGVSALLQSAARDVRIVQVGDFASGTTISGQRVVPGDGDMPLPRLVGALTTGGFDGVADLEILGPRIDEEGPRSAIRRGLAWLADHTNQTGVTA
ncbi:sugar phosphate isomerase/epimerase family protein [Dactylosporangium sp. AC04546]|uniref:sugar phosphate isomerase/epimerase family protein n=1 Tax=Dactylosporangium sp. AC04546 TaxID=2862460 RepID=UPI001EDD9AF2|nr:sugar phosphate isomerase/epimerase family protein [Dactylosporangium sp. AC04546]WVK86836.1 sugar phosphate isomerase/epimerase family protein [Dactylosporangium sp. AC04546]